ncbi:MAG: hypothetical protein KC485_02280 [Gemmatimonadetes bacterium]|nr:hypothetical protein [Gemmatimonadota bacterium]
MLILAAILCVGVGLAHTILGERYILVRLFRRTDLPHLFGDDVFTRRTLRFAWHLTTVAWWGYAALLVGLAAPDVDPRTLIRWTVAGVFATHALLTLIASRGRHLAWPVFAAIALLALFTK